MKVPGAPFLSKVILGCVTAVLGLGVAVLLGVFWSPESHWPFAAPTTTSITTVTVYPIDVASKAVTTGCGTAGRLISDSTRYESRGVPVTSSALGALNKIEVIDQIRAVEHQYSSIVSAASGVSATLQRNAGSRQWGPVTTALKTLAAQCRLLGLPTGTSVASNP
jgi:hypothetical protein